jgi:hypothetical protein
LSGTDIFISYSRSDRTVARHLAQRFEEEGLSVWWDAALHPGETFDEVIERNLRAACSVVVLWSPRSVNSRWVRAEATLADRLNKLAPVIIEDCERPIIFQLTQTTDLTEWNGDRDDPVWRRLIDDLRRNIERGGGAASVGAAPVTPAPARRFDPEAALQRRERAPARQPAMALAEDPTSQSAMTAADPLEPHASTYHTLEPRNRIAGGGERFVVTTAGLRIGRTPPSDVVLADPMVSRAHCLIELADDRLVVTDLRSTNGTFVDGKKVEGKAFLEVGAVLRVGKVEFEHCLRTAGVH